MAYTIGNSITGYSANDLTDYLKKTEAAVTYVNKTDRIFPAGMIIPFGGSTAPTGWLLCQGAQVLQSTYAALYSVIGNVYAGEQSTSAGYFRLPDLRGLFLKGVGSTFSVALDITSGYTPENISRGAYQEASYLPHYHEIDPAQMHVDFNEIGSSVGSTLGIDRGTANSEGQIDSTVEAVGSNVITGGIIYSADNDTIISSAEELRPNCCGVNYIISY